MSHVIDIVGTARVNTFYRRVVYTGDLSQLVVMALRPHESIGAERHRAVEQTLIIVEGSGKAILDERRFPVRAGDAVVITPGTRHNLIAGADGMKLYTVYTPPNHIDGTIHRTKADAKADEEDRAFGQRVGY